MATIAENIQTLRSIKSDIKNAIIQKGGSVTDAFGTYAQAITDLPSGGGGGTEIEDALITRTLSGTYYNNRVSEVGDYAFARCRFLSTVNLPKITFLGDGAFYYCISLTSIDLPKCSKVSKSAFYACSSLSSVSLPNCSYIGNDAFGYCWSLTSLTLSKVKTLGAYTFNYCSALTSINLPNCTDFDYGTFEYCTNLTQVYLNSVSRVTTIYYDTFSNCPNLTSIYVPSSLVDAFKTAPNWSSISDKIVAYREIVNKPDESEIGVGGDLGGGDNIEID